jgi:N-methylhydantoinase A
MNIIGIDTGGTFTDFVALGEGGLRVHKVLSTPQAPERAILQGIEELGLDPRQLLVIHGSTVATNAALEGKGVRTLYIGNRGLGDLLTIGRQARAELYNLQPGPGPVPVPQKLCLEVDSRCDAQGRLIAEPSAAELGRLKARIAALNPRSVAINLLFSWLHPEQEQAIARLLPDGVFPSLSSEVLPEIREYERGMATWLNGWVGPLVEGYLERLEGGLAGARVAVMQSSGETIAAAQAGRQAVRMLLSGPAGGLVGARFVAQLAGRDQLLTFDMGGTSTDVALINGEPRLTSEGRIGPWPVAVPMVDMHTIGAGGGSIARVDDGGMLLVGPESAGASPGPACYGKGGQLPTVTDANLILGRLQGDAFLGGRMTLDREASERAMSDLADRLEADLAQAAAGVIRLANEHMAQALRVISVGRGIDPRDHTLVSFGGAGGLHVCALAEMLGMGEALVPIHGGVLSALGMTASRPGRRLTLTHIALLAELAGHQLDQWLDELAERGRSELEQEGIPRDRISSEFSLDLRYRGQSYTLNIPWQGIAETSAAFHQAHAARYGHRIEDGQVELVNLNASIRGPAPAPTLPVNENNQEATPYRQAVVHGHPQVPVYHRDQLSPGQRVQGPAILTETVSTTWLAPDWQAQADRHGNLLMHHAKTHAHQNGARTNSTL